MQPQNSKSLFHFICEQIISVPERKISTAEGQAISSLAKQAHNLLVYELQRAKTQIELDKHNYEFKKNLEIREIEGKPFDKTI